MLSWLNVGRSVTAPSASSFSLFSAKARPVAVDDEWEEQSRSGDILSRLSGSALRGNILVLQVLCEALLDYLAVIHKYYIVCGIFHIGDVVG